MTKDRIDTTKSGYDAIATNIVPNLTGGLVLGYEGDQVVMVYDTNDEQWTSRLVETTPIGQETWGTVTFEARRSGYEGKFLAHNPDIPSEIVGDREIWRSLILVAQGGELPDEAKWQVRLGQHNKIRSSFNTYLDFDSVGVVLAQGGPERTWFTTVGARS